MVAAVAMAQESHLENRVTAMLDPHIARSPLGRGWAPVAALAVAVVSVLLTAIRAGGATVEGVIFDASGAVVPDAGVALVRDDLRYITRSGPDGAFRFARVPRGRYEFQAMHQGFRRLRRSDLVLVGGSTYRIRPTLEIGTIHESLRVTAAE